MNIYSLNSWFSPAIEPYLSMVVDINNIRCLIAKTADIFQAQIENCIFVGVGLSAVGTAYTYIYENRNRWVLYGSACVVCLGVAYRQGWLEQALDQAQRELEKVKKNLAVAETALLDRELLLKELKELAELVIQAGENEKNLLAELDTMRKQQEVLSNITAELTTTLNFFKGLKDSYPDEKTFFDHMSSIEKLTQSVKNHLEKNDPTIASRHLETIEFLKGLDKQSLDQMALLLTIKEGVVKANTSLDELKVSKEALV
ncbi:MAG: hypothetical protein JSS09_04560 [Verrucomicrobia bacterium]|nr:hypothetical protein [Verrucomicrobiota bacterium]